MDNFFASSTTCYNFSPQSGEKKRRFFGAHFFNDKFLNDINKIYDNENANNLSWILDVGSAGVLLVVLHQKGIRILHVQSHSQ
jgi:hypothetical protein